jgi:hypothetical protein
MKKLFLIIGMVAMSVSVFAQANITYPGEQLGARQFTGGTNNVPAASAITRTTASISVPTGGQFALSVQFKCDGANSGNTLIYLKPSDSAANTSYSTIANQALILTIPNNGTSQVNWITNINAGAIPAYFITTVTNSAASGNVTNLQIRVVSKTNI